MKAIDGYFLIKPEDLHWRPSNMMKIPNADFLERTQSEILGARLWRLPPNSANTLHKHIRAEEFYFVVEGVGRIRVGDEALTVPKHGGVLVGPSQLRQVFNDTDAEVLWLIVGAPEELEFLPGAKTKPDMSLIYPVDSKQLPKELAEGLTEQESVGRSTVKDFIADRVFRPRPVWPTASATPASPDSTPRWEWPRVSLPA
jgi:mannose-6-phosphate isomerase-like protein (cupin superfamily)